MFADEDPDLLALRGDIPISIIDTPTFAAELTVWLDELNTLPIYLSGFPQIQASESRTTVYGVATGNGARYLTEADITPPVGSGMISGPAGALLSNARTRDLDAVGLIVETDPRFPDPEGARLLIEDGIQPLIGMTIDTDPLIEQATAIIDQREALAEQMHDADRDVSSRASSVEMYYAGLEPSNSAVISYTTNRELSRIRPP